MRGLRNFSLECLQPILSINFNKPAKSFTQLPALMWPWNQEPWNQEPALLYSAHDCRIDVRPLGQLLLNCAELLRLQDVQVERSIQEKVGNTTLQ
jgi:hypothetical protein